MKNFQVGKELMKYFHVIVIPAFHILTLCILMDFPIHIDTISMGLPIVQFKGSHVEFSKFWYFTV